MRSLIKEKTGESTRGGDALVVLVVGSRVAAGESELVLPSHIRQYQVQFEEEARNARTTETQVQ
jgi:hypothetical protein